MNLNQSLSELSLFEGQSQPCPYLPNETSAMAFVDPNAELSTSLYGQLIDLGFRRSGGLVYRPYCPQCQACIPVRVPVADYQPNRNQRRIIKRHATTTVINQAAEFSGTHFALYEKYLASRHADSEMSATSESAYMDFVSSEWCNTQFHEFHYEGDLIAVCVADHLERGLSAVYTYFDPDFAQLSPGQYAILWLIEEAKRLAKPFVYLGYWIEHSQKMAYKANYRPIEALFDQQWCLFQRNENISL